MSVDVAALRTAMAAMPSDHDAAGEQRPTVSEIFAPAQHANALDPNTPVVVGARGAGKSFWAGVLEQEDTREVAATAYPHLGLERVIVVAGYTGFSSSTGISSKIIDARVPAGKEETVGVGLWEAVIIRAVRRAVEPHSPLLPLKEIMVEFADPEDAFVELERLDRMLTESNRTALITFDALDTLSRVWKRSSLLIDALFEVVWSLRARRNIRAKIFIRPDQLDDEALRFVELPKLRSGRVQLKWTQLDLYGLLFWRLSEYQLPSVRSSFASLLSQVGASLPPVDTKRRAGWPLLDNASLQRSLMKEIAGPYMGRGYKKGGTYDWPYNHLGDSNGEVTPRSFIKLFVEAAKAVLTSSPTVLSPESIRHGLREASKVRVDQLGIEYPWVKRALAPLAGLTVPCAVDAIYARWSDSGTTEAIATAAIDPDRGFTPPVSPNAQGNPNELLAAAMERIGLLAYRHDGRVDIPDLFRVAALMLKKGGTPPSRKR